jgi:hypothetical protein
MPETALDNKDRAEQELKPILSTLIWKKTQYMKEAKWKAAEWP